MSLSPIPRVLSTLKGHGVRALLMGGQACILYGAAEFSRDIDIAVAVDARNLLRLRSALAELEAVPVYFPRLTARALRKGHACHFRCRAEGLYDVRLDVMSVMRGAAPFASLWRRRIEMSLPGRIGVALMAIEDLVRVKKTQRDKDWPMVRRLVEADIAAAPRRVAAARVAFWLRECRTPDRLVRLCRLHRGLAPRVARARPAVDAAFRGDLLAVEAALRTEEEEERRLDRAYWAPLKAELERMRLARPRRSDGSRQSRARRG